MERIGDVPDHLRRYRPPHGQRLAGGARRSAPTVSPSQCARHVFIDLLSQGPVAAVPMGDDTLFIAGDETGCIG
ncbi:MAG: hypothetical protein WKF58_05930 [Ilumatobacteraceae bacterium]